MFKRIAILSFVLVLIISTAVAQEGMPPPPEITGDIVAEGLTGPQGLHVDADGNLWIVDSGFGGEEEIEFANPNNFEVMPATFGYSSRVIKISPDGTQEEIATLPSVVVGEDAIGGARITVLDGTPYVTVGSWHMNDGEEVTTPMFGQVVKIVDGEAETVADIWAVELENNPDETTNVETHPYDIIAGDDGWLYMTDAAGNALYRVDPESGDVELITAFEGMPGVFPNPFRGGELLADPVPTGVTFGEDGTLYVSFLSGAPFIPGSAKVVQVAEDGTVSDFAPGLTMVTDVTTGPDGNLYATQFGLFTEEGPVFNSGSIVRILEDGSSEVVVDGLPFLTAIAFNDAGDAYVTINGAAIPQAGMVVRYDNLVEMPGEPIEMMEPAG